jgi:hypothetical protein
VLKLSIIFLLLIFVNLAAAQTVFSDEEWFYFDRDSGTAYSCLAWIPAQNGAVNTGASINTGGSITAPEGSGDAFEYANSATINFAMTPEQNPKYLDPLDTEAVRAFVREGLQRTLNAMNEKLKFNFEASLVEWKGRADLAAGKRQPLPPKPAPPARLVLAPDVPGQSFNVLAGPPIEFTDVEVAMPYEDGFFPPQEFLGRDRFTGELIYNAKPGCQYPNGAIYEDAKGKFEKVRTPFNANGGGYWVKIN